MLFYGGKMVIEVNKYSLNPRWFVAGTKGSYGNEKLEFVFSKEWDGLSKKVNFIPFGGEEISVYYTGPIDIPYEVMVRAGTCVFGVSGYRDGVKILSVTGELKVLDTVASPDNSEYVPTPDEMTQMLNIANDALDASNEAKSIAQQAKDESAEVLENASALLEETSALSDDVKSKYDVMCEQYESAHAEYLDTLEIKEEIDTAAEAVESAKSEVQGNVQLVSAAVTEAESASALAKEYSEKTAEDLAAVNSAKDEAISAKDETLSALDATKSECRRIFSNALKGEAQGRAILIEDSLPYEQNLNVTVQGNSLQESVPSSSAPVEISNVSEPKLSMYSKNMIPYPFQSGSVKVNGVEMSPESDGGILMNGTIGSNFSTGYALYKDENSPAFVLRKGVTYRLSCVNGDNISIRLCSDGYSTVLSTSASVLAKTITPEKDIPIYKILGYFFTSDEGVELVDEKIYPMLEVLRENTDFEPYASQSVQIPLELCGVDDCADELSINGDGGAVILKKSYASYIFTGEEEWNISSQEENTTLVYIDVPCAINEKFSDVKYQLCNRLPIKDVTAEFAEGVFVSPERNSDGTSRIYARLGTALASTSDFNSAFVSGDSIIYPTDIEEIDHSETDWGKALLATKAYPNAFTLDCDGNMTVKYTKDINKEIDKIYRAVISLGAIL